MCVRARACVRACMCACVRVRACVCVWGVGGGGECACVHACMRRERVAMFDDKFVYVNIVCFDIVYFEVGLSNVQDC